MISGSWRRILLKVVPNVKPISLITWTWFIPSIFISTGSSTVIIFLDTVLSICNILYTVVDLPEPVAPATKIIPFGTFINLFILARFFSDKPRFSKPADDIV